MGCLLAGRTKSISLVTAVACLIERLTCIEYRVGILLERCPMSALGCFDQRSHVLSKVFAVRNRLAIFLQPAGRENQVAEFGQNRGVGLNNNPLRAILERSLITAKTAFDIGNEIPAMMSPTEAYGLYALGA